MKTNNKRDRYILSKYEINSPSGNIQEVMGHKMMTADEWTEIIGKVQKYGTEVINETIYTTAVNGGKVVYAVYTPTGKVYPCIITSLEDGLNSATVNIVVKPKQLYALHISEISKFEIYPTEEEAKESVHPLRSTY